MGEGRNVYRVLVGKPEGKRPLERPRRRGEDGIKMCFREIGWGSMEWIRLAHDRDLWLSVVNAVINPQVLAQSSYLKRISVLFCIFLLASSHCLKFMLICFILSWKLQLF
jgi:hypothetical protein